MTVVSIALGSNIDPEHNLKVAASMLRKYFPDIRFSSVYKTKARDREDQPDFLNATATFESEESPPAIHEKLEAIERTLKKHLPFPKGPRTIDLDLLLYDNDVIHTPDLTVPHPRMHERRFVLEPLTELLDSEKKHPILGKTWGELQKAVLDQHIQRLMIHL